MVQMSVNALTEHESFLREFIALYKQQPVLWDQKHPQYKNRTERSEAYDALLEIAKQYYPNADSDFVKSKIDSLRSVFRKEHKKVLKSKENSDNTTEIYKPQLWYYDLLLFTTGEEDHEIEEKQSIKESTNKVIYWSRENTAILIENLKNHPCLYCLSDPHYKKKSQRKKAISDITQNLINTTGKIFLEEEVKKKITLIKAQYADEMRKIKNGGSSTYWCLDILSFLEKNSNKGLKRKTKSDSESEYECDEDNIIKIEVQHDGLNDHVDRENGDVSDSDDIYDTIAKNVAYKLRTMNKKQRVIAEKLIQEVLYHGQMEQLTKDSKLIMDVISRQTPNNHHLYHQNSNNKKMCDNKSRTNPKFSGKKTIGCQTDFLILMKEETLKSSIVTKFDPLVKKEYEKALNFINSCHIFINGIVQKRAANETKHTEKKFILPMVTNYFPLFSWLLDSPQRRLRKCVNLNRKPNIDINKPLVNFDKLDKGNSCVEDLLKNEIKNDIMCNENLIDMIRQNIKECLKEPPQISYPLKSPPTPPPPPQPLHLQENSSTKILFSNDTPLCPTKIFSKENHGDTTPILLKTHSNHCGNFVSLTKDNVSDDDSVILSDSEFECITLRKNYNNSEGGNDNNEQQNVLSTNWLVIEEHKRQTCGHSLFSLPSNNSSRKNTSK